MRQIKKKLHSCAGESLAETLVAVLVIAFALTMLAGMISATLNIVNTSKTKMNDYYTENAKLERLEGNDSLTISISDTDDAVTMDMTVKVTTNKIFGNSPVIAYSLE